MLSDIKTHLTVGERAQSDVVVINDGKYPVTGILSVPERENGRIERSLSEVTPAGEMTILPGEKAVVGRFSFFASDHTRDSIEERFVTLAFGPLLHTVKFYLFPDSIPVCPENVLEVSDYSERAVEWMRRGGTVFFTIRRSESEKRRGGSVKADHPLFQAFRTEAWFDERWRLFDGCRGFELPIGDEAIVSSLVHPFDGRFPALLFEGRVAAGQFLASSLGLKEKLSEPAARTLLSDIYDYAGSVLFSPAREYRPEELAKILHSIQ